MKIINRERERQKKEENHIDNRGKEENSRS